MEATSSIPINSLNYYSDLILKSSGLISASVHSSLPSYVNPPLLSKIFWYTFSSCFSWTLFNFNP